MNKLVKAFNKTTVDNCGDYCSEKVVRETKYRNMAYLHQRDRHQMLALIYASEQRKRNGMRTTTVHLVTVQKSSNNSL